MFHISMSTFFVLKLFRDVAVLYFSGKVAQINVFYISSFLNYTLLFSLSHNIILKFQISCLFSRNKKKSSMIGGAEPLIIFKASTINTCKFLCVVISLGETNLICWFTGATDPILAKTKK